MTATTERGRDLSRAWAAAIPKLAAALPDKVDPTAWLASAGAALRLPILSGCQVPALIRIAMDAARDGVPLTAMQVHGRIAIGRRGAPRWALTHHGLGAMLAHVTGQMTAATGLVADGDHFEVFRNDRGITQIIHVVRSQEGTREWTHAWARTASTFHPMLRLSVVSRQEAEDAHARLRPNRGDTMPDFARLLALTDVIGQLPIPHPTWPPAARLLAAARRINPPRKPRAPRTKRTASP